MASEQLGQGRPVPLTNIIENFALRNELPSQDKESSLKRALETLRGRGNEVRGAKSMLKR